MPSYLLLESGDRFLLEDASGALLLESGEAGAFVGPTAFRSTSARLGVEARASASARADATPDPKRSTSEAV